MKTKKKTRFLIGKHFIGFNKRKPVFKVHHDVLASEVFLITQMYTFSNVCFLGGSFSAFYQK